MQCNSKGGQEGLNTGRVAVSVPRYLMSPQPPMAVNFPGYGRLSYYRREEKEKERILGLEFPNIDDDDD